MEKKEDEKIPPEDMMEDVAVPRAPDGGWGWMVVLGSFMCNVVVDGIIFSYGILLPDLADDLQESKGKLAWVGSLLAGFYLIAGPIVSGLANTYGTRPVCIIGAVISATSFALASQAPTVEWLCLTFGLFGGIGFGFIYLPAVVTVGFYFERRRAFATGLAVCGSGVGTFLMAPFVHFLLGRYDWRTTLLVLAAVLLSCALFGALFRPLTVRGEHQKSLLQRIRVFKAEQKEEEVLSYAVPQVSISLPEMSSALKSISGVPSGSAEDNSPPPSYQEVVEDEERFSFLRAPRALHISPSSDRLTAPKRPRYTVRPDLARPFYRQDILYSASLLHLPEFKKSHNDISLYAASVTRIPESEDGAGGGCLSAAMRDTFRQMLDVSLLRSPTFLLLAAGGFLTLAGFFVPFMFIVDRAVHQGISPDQANYILPVIGLANTLGRVLCGWLSDRPSLDALALNNAALLVAGGATMASPFLHSLEPLLLYGTLFGFCIGCFATLRSIVIVDLLGLEKLTNAFGLLLLFQGIASMLGAPVAGMFYDATNSYDASFYIAGALMLLSGLAGLPLKKISSWEKRRKMPQLAEKCVPCPL